MKDTEQLTKVMGSSTESSETNDSVAHEEFSDDESSSATQDENSNDEGSIASDITTCKK